MPHTAHAEVFSNPPVIALVDNQPRTFSTDVSAYFRKRHNDVMRQVRNLLKYCPHEWGLRNFALSSYINEQGKKQPCYSMTKDGFTLLAMGFTGPKALQFKLAYIEAFNRMAAMVHGNASPAPWGLLVAIRFVIGEQGHRTQNKRQTKESEKERQEGHEAAARRKPHLEAARQCRIDHGMRAGDTCKLAKPRSKKCQLCSKTAGITYYNQDSLFGELPQSSDYPIGRYSSSRLP